MRREGGREQVIERAVTHGVDLRQYGREHHINRPVHGTSIERRETRVMVDAAHVRGAQLLPVEEVYEDTSHPGDSPIAETQYGYAERPDGTVALHFVHQLARVDGVLKAQHIDRNFRDNGDVEREQLEVNGRRRRERVYAITWSMEGEMVYDTVFDEEGRLTERIVYFQPVGEKEWRTAQTRYRYEEDGRYHEEAAGRSLRLSGPPPLMGERLRDEVAVPELPYESPEPVFSFETT